MNFMSLAYVDKANIAFPVACPKHGQGGRVLQGWLLFFKSNERGGKFCRVYMYIYIQHIKNDQGGC